MDQPTKIEEVPVTDLVKTALADTRELVKLEVELARDEMKKEVKAAGHAAIGFGVGVALGLVGLSVLAVALVLALGGSALTALIVGLCFLAAAGVAGALGYSALPKKPMEETRARVQDDMQHLKENIA